VDLPPEKEYIYIYITKKRKKKKQIGGEVAKEKNGC